MGTQVGAQQAELERSQPASLSGRQLVALVAAGGVGSK